MAYLSLTFTKNHFVTFSVISSNTNGQTQKHNLGRSSTEVIKFFNKLTLIINDRIIATVRRET